MWVDYHLTPIPTDAPPYVLTGASHQPMRVVTYDAARATTVALDERWAIDHTEVDRDAGPDLRPGDLVVYTGRRGRTWWSPARVLHTRRRRAGVEITTLRDRSTQVLHADDIEPGLADTLLPQDGYLTDDLKRAVLDQWGLDVWCPDCGSSGAPVLYGLPASDPNAVRDETGRLRPWPAGNYDLAGCVRLGTDPGYRCHRCGAEWGGALGRLQRAGVATTAAELLLLTGCVTVETLEDLLTDYAGQPVDVLVEHPDACATLNLRLEHFGIDLPFPLRAPDVWDAVDTLLESADPDGGTPPPATPRPDFGQWPRRRARG